MAAAAASVVEPSAARRPATKAARPRRRPARRKPVLLGALIVLALVLGAGYVLKDRYAYRGAEFSRSVIGDEATARVESWYLSVEDRVDRTKFSLFGGDTNPFEGNSNVALASEAPHQLSHLITATRRAQSPILFAATVCSTALSNLKSATKCLSLRLSSASGRDLRSSRGPPPAASSCATRSGGQKMTVDSVRESNRPAAGHVHVVPTGHPDE